MGLNFLKTLVYSSNFAKVKLFTLRDAADPGFKVIGPKSHKPRNPSTRKPKIRGTSKHPSLKIQRISLPNNRYSA